MTFKKIRFVTDSVCDIPADLVAKWQISVVPCYVNYDGESHLDDGKDLSREEFFRRLPSMRSMPTTAAPSVGITEQAITAAAQDADHVIIITTPAKLSGIYNAMRLGASNIPAEKVSLVDSGTLTMALGWQVLIAAEVAKETGDVQKTLNAIQKVRANQKLYAALATMEFLRRSGRVGWAAASLGALLQIKPILNVTDGEVTRLATIRTFGKAVEKLVELTRADAPLDRLAIMHANNPSGAEDLKKQLGDTAPADTIIIEVGPTLGTHIGPGALGVLPVSKSWRQ
ncbi:MAG: DegV family protein [Anaerolineae bacterium]